jgi:hypothetical protein
MQQPLDVIRGTTGIFTLTIKTKSGATYTPPSSSTLRFGVKKKPSDTSCIFVKDVVGSSAVNGVITFTIGWGDTINLPFGCYWYDIGLLYGSAYYNIIECSPFRVNYNITDFNAAAPNQSTSNISESTDGDQQDSLYENDMQEGGE